MSQSVTCFRECYRLNLRAILEVFTQDQPTLFSVSLALLKVPAFVFLFQAGNEL